MRSEIFIKVYTLQHIHINKTSSYQQEQRMHYLHKVNKQHGKIDVLNKYKGETNTYYIFMQTSKEQGMILIQSIIRHTMYK